MHKLSLSLLAAFTLIIVSCTQEKHIAQQNSSPTPVSLSTPSPSPQLNASNGVAGPEVGDNSSEDFDGTAGIVEKKRPGIEPPLLREVRTGRHANFDRVVFEFTGPAVPGYHIEYVDKPVLHCGSGNVVAINGKAFLLVRLLPANAHDEKGQLTLKQRELMPNLPMVGELKLICDFEAEVEWVLGVSKANRYRVLELSNPARLVIDLKYQRSV